MSTNRTSQAIKKLIQQFEPVKETYIWDKETAIAMGKYCRKMEEALGQIRQTEQCKLEQDITNEALGYDPIAERK